MLDVQAAMPSYNRLHGTRHSNSGDYDDGFDDYSVQNHAYTAITTTCGDLFIVDYVFTFKNVSLSNVSREICLPVSLNNASQGMQT